MRPLAQGMDDHLRGRGIQLNLQQRKLSSLSHCYARWAYLVWLLFSSVNTDIYFPCLLVCLFITKCMQFSYKHKYTIKHTREVRGSFLIGKHGSSNINNLVHLQMSTLYCKQRTCIQFQPNTFSAVLHSFYFLSNCYLLVIFYL